jgi:hypothetical protein
MLGTWLVAGRKLQPDGRTWIDNPHPSQWRFYRILNDHAIQDDYISPAPHVEIPERDRLYGTNIRIFDPASDTWTMAWIGTGAHGVLEFSATWQDGTIVMESIDQKQLKRNIFHDFTPRSFSWRQEWSIDGGASWVIVSVLEATRTGE